MLVQLLKSFKTSVPDPNPDPHFLGHPDPLVRGMDPDPDPDPSVIKQSSKKNLDSYCVVMTSFGILSMKTDVYVPSKSNMQKTFFKN
jgi:hypothetical protein